MACFFEVFRTLLKCSPIWAQKANACTILELSRLFWYPYHLWKWLSSGDIAVFKIFLQIFLLQRHLVTVFHKWKINFKVFLIDLVPFRYFFHAFWWPNQKKCLVYFSRDTSLWKESTENLSVCSANLRSPFAPLTLTEKSWFLSGHYLTRFRGERGVKRSGRPQGIWIRWRFALKFL